MSNSSKPSFDRHRLDNLYRETDVHEMFARTVKTYDLLNHLFSMNIDRLWRAKVVKITDAPPQARILDSCTGTADVAIAFTKKRADIRVTGIDFVQNMLDRAAEKAAAAGVADRVELVHGDAMTLPYDNESFDAATVAFGLRNLPDWGRGVAEMARVVRPGGNVVVLEFSPAPNSLFGNLYRWYMRNVMTPVGARISGYWQTYGYLYSSITHFLTPEELTRHMRAAGLVHVQTKRLSGGIAYIHVGTKA